MTQSFNCPITIMTYICELIFIIYLQLIIVIMTYIYIIYIDLIRVNIVIHKIILFARAYNQIEGQVHITTFSYNNFKLL